MLLVGIAAPGYPVALVAVFLVIQSQRNSPSQQVAHDGDQRRTSSPRYDEPRRPLQRELHQRPGRSPACSAPSAICRAARAKRPGSIARSARPAPRRSAGRSAARPWRSAAGPAASAIVPDCGSAAPVRLSGSPPAPSAALVEGDGIGDRAARGRGQLGHGTGRGRNRPAIEHHHRRRLGRQGPSSPGSGRARRPGCPVYVELSAPSADRRQALAMASWARPPPGGVTGATRSAGSAGSSSPRPRRPQWRCAAAHDGARRSPAFPAIFPRRQVGQAVVVRAGGAHASSRYGMPEAASAERADLRLDRAERASPAGAPGFR